MGRSQTKIELLRSFDLFSSCSGRELSRIGSITDLVEVRAGTVLCRQGDPGREFFVVVSGRATVSLDGAVVGSLGPGSFFGEMALLENAPRSSTVTAEDEMELYVLDARNFARLIDEVPSVARKMLAVLSRRLRGAQPSPVRL